MYDVLHKIGCNRPTASPHPSTHYSSPPPECMLYYVMFGWLDVSHHCFGLALMKQQQSAMVNSDCWLSHTELLLWQPEPACMWQSEGEHSPCFITLIYHSASVSYFALDYITMSYLLTLHHHVKFSKGTLWGCCSLFWPWGCWIS